MSGLSMHLSSIEIQIYISQFSNVKRKEQFVDETSFERKAGGRQSLVVS
jgi:hypothetical protein